MDIPVPKYLEDPGMNPSLCLPSKVSAGRRVARGVGESVRVWGRSWEVQDGHKINGGWNLTHINGGESSRVSLGLKKKLYTYIMSYNLCRTQLWSQEAPFIRPFLGVVFLESIWQLVGDHCVWVDKKIPLWGQSFLYFEYSQIFL